LVALETHSAPSEAYRTIRVNLRFANVDQQPRSLVITSAAAHEGKTTVTCNLAIAMAEGGARVCLVDADLRRPHVGELLGMDNSVGLTDVLAGEHDVHSVLIPWHEGLVTVLTSGSVPPDPNALLSSRAMANLVATLCAEFDVVVFDSPPLLPVTDALVLGKLSDGVVLVTRRGRTKRSHVKAALEAIGLSHAKLLGTVFNDVKLGIGPRMRRYGYGVTYAPPVGTPIGDHPQRDDPGSERQRSRAVEAEDDDRSAVGSSSGPGKQARTNGAEPEATSTGDDERDAPESSESRRGWRAASGRRS
jgi:capsular exopolysaccharide synthesis family protein